MTTHHPSLRILDEMQIGDHVLSWQVDKRAALGIAIVDRIKPRRDGEFDLVLSPETRFASPVPLLDLKRSDEQLARVRALKPGGGTLFRTTPAESRTLRARCRAWNASH